MPLFTFSCRDDLHDTYLHTKRPQWSTCLRQALQSFPKWKDRLQTPNHPCSGAMLFLGSVPICHHFFEVLPKKMEANRQFGLWRMVAFFLMVKHQYSKRVGVLSTHQNMLSEFLRVYDVYHLPPQNKNHIQNTKMCVFCSFPISINESFFPFSSP